MTITSSALNIAAPTELVDSAIQACKQGDPARALGLLAAALAQDGSCEQAWIWLSGLVDSDAERRFCLNRVLQINPNHAAAQRGLAALPSTEKPRPPTAASAPTSGRCAFPGCEEQAKGGTFVYCSAHWRAIYRLVVAPQVPSAESAPSEQEETLSAGALGARLGFPARDLLAACNEIGWIERGEQGWVATVTGLQLGAIQLYHEQTGVPYVHWPTSILNHPALPRALQRRRGDTSPRSGERTLRERIAAIHRTIDGHMVRSRADVVIDNWLFSAGLVHAYEYPLPTDEPAFCDFFLPTGKIYIEYWGGEREAEYLGRTPAKRSLYERAGLNLIVLDDIRLRDIDTTLPLLIAQFGVDIRQKR